MKLPGFLGKQIQSQGDSYTLQMTKRQLRLVVGIIIVILIVALVFGIWGIMRQVEVMQLRQQTQLQTEQLKLLQQKTEILDKKMESLEQLDKEIRQMVKGSESGTIPQGGGEAKTPTANSDKEEPGGATNTTQSTITSTSVTNLFTKLSRLDRLAQQRMASFYMLRNILRDGAGQDIRDLQAIAFASNNGGTTATMPSIWPTKGIITSSFGTRIDPVYGGLTTHEGLDIANDYGTPIMATAAGIVTFAGSSSGGYGNLVEIDHGNGFVTRYGHISVVLVHEGMQVKQGDTIALMGSTGKSTGSHLHYEVNINGVAVDPMLFLPIQ